MKVQQLIEELSLLNPESEVVLFRRSSDNGFSPLYSLGRDYVYVPDSTYSGEAYNTRWSADDACKDESEWETMKQMPRCVVLFPVN